MATIQLARRPAFLASVPETQSAEPARFPHADRTGGPTRPPAARTAPPLAGPLPASRGEGDQDLADIRREAMERVDAALETLRAQADHLAEQARADAIEIGFQVARKILETEVRQSPEALFALVRSAVRRAGESRRIVVRLAPDDAALLRAEEGRTALDGVTAARVEYLPDPSLQRGDCLVETDFGQVDGRLATRLSEVRRAVDAAEGAA
ncbi:MAG TPA: FliH/SctL family protein [Anaeromyxobacteraceae bacterium]